MWCAIFLTLPIACIANGDMIHFPQDDTQRDFNMKFPAALTGDSYVDDVIAQGVTNLCLSLDRSVADDAGNALSDYFVYSPLSIASALALVLLGSNGKTFEEISTLLGLAHGVNIGANSQSVHEHFGEMINKLEVGLGNNQMVKFATAVFVQDDYPIREQFRRTCTKIYKSEVMNLDFKRSGDKAQSMINNWVYDRTNGKIKDILVSQPPSETKVILISSLYFKGEWEKHFTPEITNRRAFYANGKDQPSTTQALFMGTGGEFPYYDDPTLDCQIFGMPYKGKTITFYVVIPKKSDKLKLRDLESKLNSNELNRLASSTAPSQLILLFPKMKLTTTLKLNEALQYLGLRSLFSPVEANLALLSPGISANTIKSDFDGSNTFRSNQPLTFSAKMTDCTNSTECSSNNNETDGAPIRKRRQIPISNEDSIDFIRNSINKNYQNVNPGLYADQVLHKVFIDITETGTEAAAATSVSLTRDGTRKNVIADVPFFFFIRHEQTKLILFWGSVNTPSPNFN